MWQVFERTPATDYSAPMLPRNRLLGNGDTTRELHRPMENGEQNPPNPPCVDFSCAHRCCRTREQFALLTAGLRTKQVMACRKLDTGPWEARLCPRRVLCSGFDVGYRVFTWSSRPHAFSG